MPPTYSGPAPTIVVAVERGQPASLLRISTDVGSEQRAGHIGPLERWREPLDALRVAGAVRSSMVGAVPVGQIGSWRVTLQAPADEIDAVREAVERLLDGDPSLVDAYVRQPLGGYRDVIRWTGSPDPQPFSRG